ncbi:hypothetical protein NL676_021231 [Syzygium grande]|nr:hypothetical protein NL676_021231 [Syzygium grande]
MRMVEMILHREQVEGRVRAGGVDVVEDAKRRGRCDQAVVLRWRRRLQIEAIGSQVVYPQNNYPSSLARLIQAIAPIFPHFLWLAGVRFPTSPLAFEAFVTSVRLQAALSGVTAGGSCLSLDFFHLL